MVKNPFVSSLLTINDPDDFAMPYKLVGRVDTEMMADRFMQLRKASYGYIVRLGNLW